MSGSFNSGNIGRESSAYGGSERYGGGSQNRAGGKQGGNGQGGRGGSAGVSTAEYIAGKMSGWKKDPTTGTWSNPEFNKQAGIDGRGGGSFGRNVPGNPNAPGYLDYDTQLTTMPNGQRVRVGELRSDYGDYENKGNSGWDDLGNLFASFVGFNERNPFTDKEYGVDMPTGQGASWGFDPAVALGSIGGLMAGIPFGTGTLANLISAGAGRPLEVSLGPSVFGQDTIDPETGTVIASSKTHTGPSMTVRDNNDPNTFYGTSRGLAYLAGGASNAAPSKQTFVGTDPTIEEPAPVSPYVPVMPVPKPIDTAPNSPIQIDPGNTNMAPDELTRLFLGFMAPGRTSRGRNPVSVVV